jgi:hypothetical protein
MGTGDTFALPPIRTPDDWDLVGVREHEGSPAEIGTVSRDSAGAPRIL